MGLTSRLSSGRFRRGEKIVRRARASSVSFIVMALVVAALVPTGAPSRAAHAQTPTKPNIVLILSDDQSPESVPYMPKLAARTDLIDFRNAYLNVSLCCPSRATILSGQYSHHTGVKTNHDAPTFRDSASIATWLKSAGYRTGLIGKYLNAYPWSGSLTPPPGWSHFEAFMGELDYYNYDLNVNGTKVHYGSTDADYSTDVISQKSMSFIETAAASSQPFFLMLTPNAPHRSDSNGTNREPRPATRHQGHYRNLEISHSPNFNEEDVSDKPAWVRALPMVSVSDADALRRAQYETLLALDDLIENVFLKLEQKGILENTVVVFMTDNGYSMGEHRFKSKNCEYEECMRTPLVVRYPGQSGRQVSELVQNVDLASTFTDLAGTQPTISQDGRSLVPLLKGETPTNWRTGVLLRGTGGSVPKFWGIRTSRWKYIELETGEKELYDLQIDQYEESNLSKKPEYAGIQNDLAAELAALRDGGSTATTTTIGPSVTTTTAVAGTCAATGSASVTAPGEVTGSGVFGATGDCLVVRGGDGPDSITVEPHSGTTKILGNAGEDKICARNGSLDIVKGGDGSDKALVDGSDSLESVSAVSTLSCSA